MGTWRGFGVCISQRVMEGNPDYKDQLEVGSTYYLGDRYVDPDGDVYVVAYNMDEKCVGRYDAKHFHILAASDDILVNRSAHGSLSVDILTYALPDDVKEFLSFLNIWGKQGTKHGNGTITYEVGCVNFVKSEEFRELMMEHGVKVVMGEM